MQDESAAESIDPVTIDGATVELDAEPRALGRANGALFFEL